MFIQNLRSDFYNVLIGKRVLVFVNYDIDAICASKIIQNLFRNDQIIFSVFPILGLNGLKRAFNEHKDDAKLYLFVNCGGTVDIVDLLQPEDDIIFYICDSHRPLDVCNIYSDNQVSINSVLA
jgi:cell division control protein 45